GCRFRQRSHHLRGHHPQRQSPQLGDQRESQSVGGSSTIGNSPASPPVAVPTGFVQCRHQRRHQWEEDERRSGGCGVRRLPERPSPAAAAPTAKTSAHWQWRERQEFGITRPAMLMEGKQSGGGCSSVSRLSSASAAAKTARETDCHSHL
ncbi:unnamed protein product, partial [Phaeothamnion confervicola]